MTNKLQESIGRRHSTPVHYQHNADMDFYLLWALSYVSERGGEPGELLAVASLIDEGDPGPWVSAWLELARRTERRAAGSRASAREAYLRAFTAYRTATFYLKPRDPVFRETCRDFERCFQAAAERSDFPLSRVSIPFEAADLPGYWLRPTRTSRRPTLIMIGGGESFREDLYFWAGAAGVRRGYNVLLVDLPGQGGTPFSGLALRADAEKPIGAVLDFVLSQADVDPQRVAIHGLSGGGYFVSRAVAYERRLAACIANTPIVDLGRLVTAEMPAFLRSLPAFAADAAVALASRQSPALAITLEKICWQAGVDRLSDFVKLASTFVLDREQLGRITCPTLCLWGNAEGSTGEAPRQIRFFKESLGAVRCDEHTFTVEDGAGAHCQVGNFALSQQVAFDWLDEVLG